MPEQQARSAYDGLKGKQRLFVDAYVGIANGNATRAAKEAGYAESGLRQEGYRLLTNADIRAAIDEQYGKQTLKPNQVMALLAKQATANLDEAVDERGRMDIRELKRLGFMPLVKKITYGPTGLLKSIEVYDAQGALDKIARALGLYKDDGQTAEVVIKVVRGIDVEAI